MKYSFSEEEFRRASREWGANCGPSALAFALQVPIDSVRHAIPGFEQKGYTSPTMMKAALAGLSRTFTPNYVTRPCMFSESAVSLVRVQFTGPWTAPGSNPRWAYAHTHWIATWREGMAFVFDCNGGMMHFGRWEIEILPLLTSMHKRSDGGWEPTHVWKIDPVGAAR